MRTIFLALALLLLPALGWDSSTDRSSSTSRINTRSSGVLLPGRTIFWDFNTTTDSGYLDVSQCGSISWGFDPDENGTATGATILMREATEIQATCAASAPATILTCELDGTPPITAGDELTFTGAVGRRGCRNVKPAFTQICVDVQANGTPDGARVQVTCNP